MKKIILSTCLVVAGCSDLSNQQIKFISQVCNKNGGIHHVTVYSGGVDSYCNDGAEFSVLKKDMAE